MSTFKKIALGILLPLILLVIISLFQSGSFKDLVKGGENIVKEYGPDVDIGLAELQAEDVSIPQEREAKVNAMKNVIENVLASDKSNCFATFGGFSNLGNNERSSIITMTYDSSLETTFFTVTDDIGRTYKSFSISKMQPCVVAGDSNLVENFVGYFFEDDQSLENLPYYSPVNRIEIKYSEDNINGNVIRVPEFGDAAVNDESNNFKSNGYIFKGGSNNICFFPTNIEKDADEDGIDDDFFTDSSDSESAPYKVKNDPGTYDCLK
jgi:hypothetical protein